MLRNITYTNYPHTPSALTILEDHEHYHPQRKHKESTLLKRIPIHRLMDLKIDYAFKQLFGQEKNIKITVVFLNSFLQKTGHAPISEVSFENIEETPVYDGDKESRMDLLAITQDGKRINIEIQLTNKYNMVKRSIYYWSSLYRRQMKRGMDYDELNPVIAINILNFNLFDQTNCFHTKYHLYEDDEKFPITDTIEFHFVEMPKLIRAWKEEKLDPWNDVLARWLLLLGVVDGTNNKVYEEILADLEEIAMKDKLLRESLQTWTELSLDDKEYAAYEARMKKVLDDAAFKRRMELVEEELRQAKEREKHTVKSLLARGFNLEEVIKLTDLSKKRVLEIKQSIKNE